MSSDDIVSGWLSGADSMDGHENPAGPLYTYGEAATEAAMTDSRVIELGTVSVATTCGGICC